MAETTGIAWTDSTFNGWAGCQKVGPGCDHCYAETRMDKRLHFVEWGPGKPRRRTSPKNWRLPIEWNANAEAFQAQHGRRQRVFSASLSDVFDNAVDPAWRADLFDLIEQTPNLDWLLLTKRIGNVAGMLTEIERWAGLPRNVWLGATVVNQEEADRDVPKLLGIPATVRFLSMEPLLGPVRLAEHGLHGGPGQLEWVIVGGESGAGARPMAIEWARSLRAEAHAAGAKFLMKQLGGHPNKRGDLQDFPPDLRVQEFPEVPIF